MRTRVITTVLLLLAFTLQATNPSQAQEDRKILKKAYKYRKDIDKKVLKMTKKWPEKVGVLHANWIENRQGKSIVGT